MIDWRDLLILTIVFVTWAALNGIAAWIWFAMYVRIVRRKEYVQLMIGRSDFNALQREERGGEP